MIKAVVVDDEKLVRKGFISMINWAAFGMVIVGEAADGHSALELLKHTDADLLFTDITMPGMSGFELIRQVRQQFPHIRSVVLTCHHEFDYVQEALRLGAIDYIVKTLLELESADETIARIAERFRWEESARTTGHQAGAAKPLPASSCLVFRPQGPDADKSELFQLTAVRSNPFIHLDNLELVPLVHQVPLEELSRELSRLSGTRWQSAMITGLEGIHLDEIKANLQLHLDHALFYRAEMVPPALLEYRELQHSAAAAAPGQKCLTPFLELKWAFNQQDWSLLIRTVEEKHPLPEEITAFGEALCRDWRGLLFGQTEGDQLLEAARRNRSWGEWKNWLRRYSDCAQRRMVELAFSKEVMLCLVRAMVYMRQETCGKLNQAGVADHVKMSRSYFSQCFARFAGQPFNVVLRTMRMDRAKLYLLESDTPVYEIALSVGFEDDKYFSKLFRDLVGKYPTEFRMLGGKPF
jgi:two-component system, response regulator YesN